MCRELQRLRQAVREISFSGSSMQPSRQAFWTESAPQHGTVQPCISAVLADRKLSLLIAPATAHAHGKDAALIRSWPVSDQSGSHCPSATPVQHHAPDVLQQPRQALPKSLHTPSHTLSRLARPSPLSQGSLSSAAPSRQPESPPSPHRSSWYAANRMQGGSILAASRSREQRWRPSSVDAESWDALTGPPRLGCADGPFTTSSSEPVTPGVPLSWSVGQPPSSSSHMAAAGGRPASPESAYQAALKRIGAILKPQDLLDNHGASGPASRQPVPSPRAVGPAASLSPLAQQRRPADSALNHQQYASSPSGRACCYRADPPHVHNASAAKHASSIVRQPHDLQTRPLGYVAGSASKPTAFQASAAFSGLSPCRQSIGDASRSASSGTEGYAARGGLQAMQCRYASPMQSHRKWASPDEGPRRAQASPSHNPHNSVRLLSSVAPPEAALSGSPGGLRVRLSCRLGSPAADATNLGETLSSVGAPEHTGSCLQPPYRHDQAQTQRSVSPYAAPHGSASSQGKKLQPQVEDGSLPYAQQPDDPLSWKRPGRSLQRGYGEDEHQGNGRPRDLLVQDTAGGRIPATDADASYAGSPALHSRYLDQLQVWFGLSCNIVPIMYHLPALHS